MSSVGSHPVNHEELMAFLDGQPCGDVSAMAAHLESCVECRGMAEELRATSAKLAAWSVEAPSVGIQHRVLSAASGGSSSKRPLLPREASRKRWTLIAGGAGFAVVLLIAITAPDLQRRAMVARENTPINQMRTMEMEVAMLNNAGNSAKAMQKQRELAEYAARNPEAARKLQEQQLEANLVPKVEAPVDQPAYYGALPHSVDNAGVRIRSELTRAKELQGREPMIARTATLRVVVPKFEAARASLDAILVRYHAYAATLDVNTTEGSARAVTASLRVPASSLGAAFAELKALGRVENESQAGEEVTEQHMDLVARLKNARETEVRLQDILRTRTGKVKDVLEVEEEISRVRGEIEQMEAERTTLEHRVDFATVNLSLVEEYKAKLDSSAPSRGTQLRNSLVTGLRNASDSLFALVLFLAEITPVLLLWLLILSPLGWLFWRRFRAVRAVLS